MSLPYWLRPTCHASNRFSPTQSSLVKPNPTESNHTPPPVRPYPSKPDQIRVTIVCAVRYLTLTKSRSSITFSPLVSAFNRSVESYPAKPLRGPGGPLPFSFALPCLSQYHYH